MCQRAASGWAWRIPLALGASLLAAVEAGYLLTCGLPLVDPLERLYVGLFGALALSLLLLAGGLLARDLRQLAQRLGGCLLALSLGVGLLMGAR